MKGNTRKSVYPFVLDMVHHNPGEAPFDTQFTDPRELASRGYTGQVFKHINSVVRFDALGLDLWPEGSEEARWLEGFTKEREAEIRAAKAAGLKVYYHVDLFILPKRLVELEREKICDKKGRIDLNSERTLELHRVLFEELFTRFPELDGLIVRVGESYLFDTPYHMGNTAVPMHDEDLPREKQMDQFMRLLRFLREEVCVRHNRTLIHRTWDYFGDRFHAAPDYYLSVTDRVEPHENLVFSIKHVAADFFRFIKNNPCLGIGRHPQIVEVQCQREYEGKGAHPNYPIAGVLEGFPEMGTGDGVRHLAARSGLFRGVYSWSRGGGWFGPYLKNEFWPRLSIDILSRWTCEPSVPEEEHFRAHAREELGLDEAGTAAFRKLCLTANEAVLKGRYCTAHFAVSKGGWPPTGLWMRDENFGGWSELGWVFDHLFERNTLDAAVAEKQEAVALWKDVVALAQKVTLKKAADSAFLRTSAEYGLRTYTIVALGWEILAAGYKKKKGLAVDADRVRELGRQYAAAWESYRKLPEERADCATLYRGTYWNWPGKPPVPGLDSAVAGVLESL